MSYQALYRAWRPTGFSGIVGQEPITTTLQNQIKSGRIAHAYLFCGSRGTGKTSTAKVFALAINCTSPNEKGDPCGECEACRALSMETNMDVIEIDAASNNGVDEIRELRTNIKYPPSVGRYKVYIVDEVHMLSSGAFNALLKTLEEPPAHAVFILATTEPQRLPATILSRCQRYDFKRIPADVIAGKLRMELASLDREAEPEALHEIARAAEGGMRDAESLLDMCLAYSTEKITAALVRDVLGSTDRAGLFRFAGALLCGDAAEALRQIDTQMRAGRDAQLFAREIAGHMRALILAQLMPGELSSLLDLTEEDAQRYIAQSQGAAQPMLTRIMGLFSQIESELRWATQPRTAIELCAVRACQPEREQSIEALLSRIDLLEEKLRSGAFSVKASEASAPAEGPAQVVPPPAPVAPPRSAPKPAPAAKPKSPEGWDQALTLISEKAKPLHGPLAHHHSATIDGDTLRIGFLKKDNVFMILLKREEKIQQLEALISESLGRTFRVSIEEDVPGTTKSASSAAPSAFDEAYNVFGREFVSIVDEL